ncbi:MAG TPA: amino acid--[acyl-carrier-protein] ligase [Solirubrobacteraceae bacterium]|nr:amino acid--[acyl-carrier-protein] ligase [Solirubrobacteraceae bacterium]
MPGPRSASPDQADFLTELVAAGLLVPTGVPGIYGRTAGFQLVLDAVAELVSAAAAPEAPEQLRFPPVMARHQLERLGYLKSFPHLAGSIFAFSGSEEEAAEQDRRASRHEDWSEFQQMTDLVMTPAACYPVYPAVAARGPLGPGGVMIDAGGSYVFRREPSLDPARLQMFHQRELVRIAEPETVRAWRDAWRERAEQLLATLGLDVSMTLATDPFFGRSGRMLAASQRSQELKFEVLGRIAGPELTALASFNYHQDHFSSAYDIRLENGGVAHTACLGFGLERITLALIHAHGTDLASWPAQVRGALGTA